MPGKVLVVDDNPTNLKLARVVLSAEGLEVRIAASAEDALKVLEAFTPRIIVMALTAYAMKGDMEKALAAGCDGYMSKPIDPATLCAVVQRYLQSETEKKDGD